jgi:N-methylhydantoinase A
MTLVPFGGAGPMFACRVAESLGMSRALIPLHAGVLSAIGLASAPERIEYAASFHGAANETSEEDLEDVFHDLEQRACDALPDSILARHVDCRYPGQGYELTVSGAGGTSAIASTFHHMHRERYGHADEGKMVEVVNARVVATRQRNPMELQQVDWDGDGRIPGPTSVSAPDFTLRIEAGWSGTRHPTGAVLLERT